MSMSGDDQLPARILARATEAPALIGDQVFQRLLRHRIIFLGQQVDDDLANRICAELVLLAAEDPKRDICIYINSPGGSVSAGLAIYDMMQYVQNDVATYAMGMAASMGQFLLCAGATGKRYAMPHAAGHAAPAARRHRRHRLGHQDPGRADPVREADAGRAHGPAHRPDGRADREGLRPGPLVHRRAGQGVRLRRPRGAQRRRGSERKARFHEQMDKHSLRARAQAEQSEAGVR